MAQSYRDLEVWQLAMELVKRVYLMTRHLPDSERFGLISQMQRCAVSVPANIAEGWAREQPRDFARFLGIARGSLVELETFLHLCIELEYFTKERLVGLVESADRVGRMLLALQRTQRSD